MLLNVLDQHLLERFVFVCLLNCEMDFQLIKGELQTAMCVCKYMQCAVADLEATEGNEGLPLGMEGFPWWIPEY